MNFVMQMDNEIPISGTSKGNKNWSGSSRNPHKIIHVVFDCGK